MLFCFLFIFNNKQKDDLTWWDSLPNNSSAGLKPMTPHSASDMKKQWCQLCLQDTSHSKWHRQAAVGHRVPLCAKCCRMVDSVPRWRLSPTNWPIQSDHLSLADYDDTAFGSGTLTCSFLERRSMTVEKIIWFIIVLGIHNFVVYVNLCLFKKLCTTRSA